MSTDTTVVLPPNSGGPSLDAEQYTQKSSTVVDRERIASVAGTPTAAQTTLANVAVSSSGATVVVAAVGGQTVRVMRMMLTTLHPVNIEFLDGASTVLAGPFVLQAGGAIVLDDSGEPWFVTSSGNAFEINLSVAGTVQVSVWYTQS